MNRESYSAATDGRLRRGGPLLSEPKVALAVFILFALVPAFVSGYPVYILPQYLLYGMLGMSLGILWGFTGILSFGQAAFFLLSISPTPGFTVLRTSKARLCPWNWRPRARG